MDGAFAFLLAIVFFVILMNFFALFMRMRRDRRPKTGRVAMDEKRAAVLRAKEIQRRLDREQEEAIRQIERRNKTLELYEQVRRNAAAAEGDSAAAAVDFEADAQDKD